MKPTRSFEDPSPPTRPKALWVVCALAMMVMGCSCCFADDELLLPTVYVSDGVGPETTAIGESAESTWTVRGSTGLFAKACETESEFLPPEGADYEVIVGPGLTLEEVSACVDAAFQECDELGTCSYPPTPSVRTCQVVPPQGAFRNDGPSGVQGGEFTATTTCTTNGMTTIDLCLVQISGTRACTSITVMCGGGMDAGMVDAGADTGADAEPDSCVGNCPAGQFLSGSCSDSCMPCTGGTSYDCGAGQYRTGIACDGTTTEDTQRCEPCTGGATWDCLSEEPSSYRDMAGSACEGTGTSDTQMCTPCTICEVSCIPRPGTGDCNNTTDTDCVCG